MSSVGGSSSASADSVGFHFTERMTGYFSRQVKKPKRCEKEQDVYLRGYKCGKGEASSCTLIRH
jgi:hypothetical protein